MTVTHDPRRRDLAPRRHHRRGYRLAVVARVMTGKNRIMIYGPKDDGTYVVEFRTADGDCNRRVYFLHVTVPTHSHGAPGTFR